MLHVLIIQLYFHTWLLIGRDVSCHTYHRFHATLIGIQPVSSQSCCAAALETSDKPLWSGNSLLPLRALQCFTPSQHQTLSTPASKDVYLTRVIKRDRVANLPSTYLFGVKGHTWNYCVEEGEPGDEASEFQADLDL